MADRLSKILLVEDDADDAFIAQSVVKKFGLNHAIDWVDDGEKALQYLEKKGIYKDKPTPNVVLLDLQLPIMHGIELLKKIRSHSAFKSLPVYLLTNSRSPQNQKDAQTYHAAGFYKKPLEIDQFRELLNVLHKKSALSPHTLHCW